MILETSFPPLIGQKGAKELKITSEELSWMVHTCTSLISQAENTLGFQLSSHRARSLLHEQRAAGKGGWREPGVPGHKADAAGCGEGRTPCESRGWGSRALGTAKVGVPPPWWLQEDGEQTNTERGWADTCSSARCNKLLPSLGFPE